MKLKVFILSIMCFALSCSSLFGKPSIQFSKLDHDFGSIKQNTIVKETIKFKNIGNSNLIITNVETSCGCTGTKVDKNNITPGEEGSLEISFNSGHYDGKIVRSILIHTNDPKNNKVTFKIMANVVK